MTSQHMLALFTILHIKWGSKEWSEIIQLLGGREDEIIS